MSYILQALKRAQVDQNDHALARGAARSSTAAARRPLWPWLVGGGLATGALVVGIGFVITHQLVVEPPPGAADNTAASTAAEASKSEAPAPPAPTESAPRDSAPQEGARSAQASAEPTPTIAAVPAESKPSPINGAPLRAQQDNYRSRPETKNGEVPSMQTSGAATPTPRADTTLALVQPPAPVRPAPPAQVRPPAPDSAIVPRQPAAPDPPADPPSRRRRRAPRGEPSSAPEPTSTLPAPRSGSEFDLKIEVLVWASDPKQRMVYLNGLKYVEGSKLAGGAVLEQIIEDGIILVQNGQRIRVKVEPR
jgi:hypothetical protein